jgi:aspartate kinase
MAIVVQKFGGTSLANTSCIKRAALFSIKEKRVGNDVVVVVSAQGDTTDRLLQLAKSLSPSPEQRELDMLLSTGEQISSALFAIAVNQMGEKAVSFTAFQAEILTDQQFTKARIIRINTERIKKELDAGKIVVVAGFQGVTVNGDITTLGRGGSDTTAVALAAALGAEVCHIYTDVDGVYTADPRIVSDARKIGRIGYDEMLELASLGAKVLQSRAVEFAKKYNVPIHVRSSFKEEEGTMVQDYEPMEEAVVTGVATDANQAKVSVLDVPDRPGVAAKLFEALAEEGIVVDMIIQSAARGQSNDISFTVAKTDLAKTLSIAKQVGERLGSSGVIWDTNIAKVSIVGVGMKSHSGVAAKMFAALASKGINIQMISTSEIKISCIIREEEAEEAMKVLHEAFLLHETKG